MADQPTTQAQRLAALRELLPATGAGIYLDTATCGPLPAETAEAMRQADDWELRVGRVTQGREEDVAQRADEARAVLAALIGASPESITLARGLDEAISLAAATVVVPLVDQVSGRLTPIAEIARHAGAGDRVAIDASDAVGAIALNVDELAVDAVAFATDRWLLGPEGTAALWTRTPVAQPGVPPRTTLVGLARSVGWLEMYVGLEWAFDRTARLTADLLGRLAAIDGVELLTPPGAHAAIASFRVTGWTASRAADELGRRAYAMLRTFDQQDVVRASVGWFNTDEELVRVADTIALLAAHTPDNLPPRPELTVLG